MDVSTNYENVEKMLNEAEQNTGPVYMLINCAGTCICGKFEEMSINDIDVRRRFNSTVVLEIRF